MFVIKLLYWFDDGCYEICVIVNWFGDNYIWMFFVIECLYGIYEIIEVIVEVCVGNFVDIEFLGL